MDARAVTEQAGRMGFDLCLEFDPALLVPEQRIRAYCIENRCGSYNANHMCPPRVGSLEEVEAALQGFSQGVLLQLLAADGRGQRPGRRDPDQAGVPPSHSAAGAASEEEGHGSSLGPDRGKLRVVPGLHRSRGQAMPAPGEEPERHWRRSEWMWWGFWRGLGLTGGFTRTG